MRTEPGERRPQRWLVAPDSFKGTYSAAEVAARLAAGFEEAGVEVDPCPLGDGGEGTVSVLLAALGGSVATVTARDPLGRSVEAELALVGDGGTAVVEMAAASGLCLLSEEERDAEAASSAGTGDLIVAAVRRGARRILLGAGGSATTDGGAGAIEAIDRAGGLGDAKLEILCDTAVSFDRAAGVFGPQKGAEGDSLRRLGVRLERQARALPRDPTGIPMTGAAGGLAGGLWATYGARLRSGAAAVLDAVGFDARATAAGLVVTGEGRLDRQSAEGKLVAEVAARGAVLGAQVHAVVGELCLSDDEVVGLGLSSATEAGDEAGFEVAARQLAEAAC
jgi:glycerate kinase